MRKSERDHPENDHFGKAFAVILPAAGAHEHIVILTPFTDRVGQVNIKLLLVGFSRALIIEQIFKEQKKKKKLGCRCPFILSFLIDGSDSSYQQNLLELTPLM